MKIRYLCMMKIFYTFNSKGGQIFQLAPLLYFLLHATRYAKGCAESCEYGDEKLDDVLPNAFLDSHRKINLMNKYNV